MSIGYSADETELKIEPPKSGIPGLDELAEQLNVEPMDEGEYGAICVIGRSGDQYRLDSLLRAHIQMMRQTLDDA